MVLYSNYDLTDYKNEARAYIYENCADEYADAGEISDGEIWRVASRWAEIDAEQIRDDIARHVDKIGAGVLAVGTVGRWDGAHDGGRVYDNFREAFFSVFRDCEYITITDDAGRLIITGAHHDGTNTAQFLALTERGRALYDKWLYDYADGRTEAEIHGILSSCNLFAKIPHFARDVYGCKEARAV